MNRLMDQLVKIEDKEDLIPGQNYMVKVGFRSHSIKYEGDNLPPGNFRYAINYGVTCEWEDNELVNNIMEVVGEFHKKIISDSKEYSILRDQIKDGSIFMNKVCVSSGDLCLEHGANIETIISTVKGYYEMANNLSLQSISYLNFDWCFYRSGGKKCSEYLETNGSITMPLPFSATSAVSIAVNWMDVNEKCCLYKIYVPGDTSFACLESFYNSRNPKQYDTKLYEGETCLPPGTLKMVKKDILEFKELGKVPFYICEFVPFSEEYALYDLKKLPQRC